MKNKSNLELAEFSTGVRSFTEQSHYYHNGEPLVFDHTKEISKDKPIVAELFSGLGGTSIGFEMAGFETVLGLDIHKPSVETFRHSHPTATVVLGDIKKILSLESDNHKSILVQLLKKRLGQRRLDVLVAGIPCQGFSMSNRKRNEDDERNYLFFYFLEAVKCLNPKVVMIENVSGLKSLSNGKFALTIEYHLDKIGYKTHHKILNAADYGVPQTRKRVVFLGNSDKISFPEPILQEKDYVSVKDAISDLPRLDNGEGKRKYDEKRIVSEFAKSMRGNCELLYNHHAPTHPQSVKNKIKNTSPGKPIYPKFKQRIRLSWNKPSPTQVSGGIRPQFQFGHPSQARGLSIRERARIQSIPDKIEIYGGIVQGRVQTGNAVPCLLAKAIALNIKEFLE